MCGDHWLRPDRIIDVEASTRLRQKAADALASFLGGKPHIPPSPPALLTAAASAGVLMIPIGAWMIGQFKRSRSVSSLVDRIASSRKVRETDTRCVPRVPAVLIARVLNVTIRLRIFVIAVLSLR